MLGGNPSFIFSLLFTFLESWSYYLCRNFVVSFFLFDVPSLASNALKVRGIELLYKKQILCACYTKILKSPEFYLFLIIFESKPYAFIYLSLVLSFFIWAVEVTRKIQSLQILPLFCIRLFYHRPMWYSRGGVPHWRLVNSS